MVFVWLTGNVSCLSKTVGKRLTFPFPLVLGFLYLVKFVGKKGVGYRRAVRAIAKMHLT